MPPSRQHLAAVWWLLLAALLFPPGAWSKTIGIFGVDKDSPAFGQHPVDAVFVLPEEENIAAQRAAGRRVFLTLDVFGGSGGWKTFPDSRPVKADGELLEPALAAICPTHPGWRQNRLGLLASWLERFQGASAIDGVWLDFIRYPGRWEEEHPVVPDTCYCPRCLAKFQADAGVRIGGEADTVAEKARWIRDNARLAFSAWKKEQIVSFAREAKQLLGEAAGDRRIVLGAFVVPWRKSDFNGALSFSLAQDAKLLAPFVDIFSPMVYHKMVKRPAPWVGEITDYYAEMTGRTLWPILQAEKVGGEEFEQVVQSVSHSVASGLLVYTFREMKDEQWPLLAAYQPPANLLRNPQLQRDAAGAGKSTAERSAGLPDGWFSAPLKKVQDSIFRYEAAEEGNVIGITAGHDRQAVWSTALPDCQPGATYLFSADFLRDDRFDSLAYPEISLWGRPYRLNTHRLTGKFQRLKAVVICPREYGADQRSFTFRNGYPGNTFRMRLPELKALGPAEPLPETPPPSDFFPIGAYGASAGNLAEMRAFGLNTAVIDMTRENVQACLLLNMRCTLTVPHNPEQLLQTLQSLEPLLAQGSFSFYVNDEPEIHSFPEGEAEDIQRILKQHFPRAATNMAIVRPQAIPFYAGAADYFMLDQYPVPNMPMAWLAESMEEAARHVGRGRLQSVIQAFGDDRHAAGGWPRLPTYEEMNCLALLSVVHGSRGIYFYTYPQITANDRGKEDFSRLVKRLSSIKSWLQAANDGQPVTLRMTSPYRFDPRGNPAVHCSRKEQHHTQMLICVNTLGTFTEAEIEIPAGRQDRWRDYYSEQPYPVVDGTILARFTPYEAKVLLELK
jgi:hypothetical protein